MNLRYLIFLPLALFQFCAEIKHAPLPADEEKTFRAYFNEDYLWYRDNVPYFECADSDIQNVYYYRWKLYKAHIRSVGRNKFVITEFINHVPWDREPYCTINAASMHHIYEGRWLKDDRYINGYINNLLADGGDDRKYSESISDAAYARYLVNADSTFFESHLDSMKAVFNGWYDHFDSSKNLYYIPAMPDATEYTIASIDASGGKDGFEDGEAFRPTINSYMYGNALAIAKAAALKGDKASVDEYTAKAAALKQHVTRDLWNDSLQHFTDRFKVDNQYVKYWNFIRGRELAGMIPWYFNLPPDEKKYAEAWQHVVDTNHLLGPYGFRTNEPSYEYYFKQFVFFEGKRGSQWNGPSWPYQSSQTLTAMANLMNNYHQEVVSVSDYVRLFRLYTKQHILPDGRINLVENYDPNNGGPIVYYYWSNHYLHSSYNNLLITGLCGIRPSESDSVEINPLVDSTIAYFMLKDVKYHGHSLSVVYDRDGSKYKIGKGVSVFVDGKKALLQNKKAFVGEAIVNEPKPSPENYALNIRKSGFPRPSASINDLPDTSLYQAVDGRIWYFPEIINYWSTKGSDSTTDWFQINFGAQKKISSARLYFFADNKMFFTPEQVEISYATDSLHFQAVHLKSDSIPLKANTVNGFDFDAVSATAIRFTFKHGNRQVAVSEFEVY